MNKRLYRSLPLPEENKELIHDVAVSGKGIRCVIAAEREDVGGEDTLILNCWQVSGKNKRDISLIFRVFCTEDDFTTLDIETSKWRSGALLNLVCRESGWSEYWWNYSQLLFLTPDDSALTEEVFRGWLSDEKTEVEGRTAFYFLERYQKKIKEKRLMKKHKKETDVIDREMEKFGAIPDDYQTFVEEKVFDDTNYIFYSTKEGWAYCTKCGWEYILENKHIRHRVVGVWNNTDEVRHNRQVRCPHCGKYLLAKSDGMSRQSLYHVEWSVLVQSHGEEVLTRYFRHTKDFRRSFRLPKIETTEEYRTVHTAEKSVDYMWAKFVSTNKVRWCYYRDSGNNWYGPSEFVAPHSVTLYNLSLQEVVKDTCMRYSVPDIFFEKVLPESRELNRPWIVDNYFNSYRKAPFIEQLLKVGFYRMTREYLEDGWRDKPDFAPDSRSILGTLKINKYQFNLLRMVGDPSLRDLEILKYKPDLKWEDYEELRYVRDNGYSNMYKQFIDFMKHTTLHKMIRYLSEQHITHEMDYFDYAGWLEEMGYDMKNEFNLFPRNFKKAHDEMSKQYIRFKDKKAREDAARFNRLLRKLQKETADVDAMNLEIDDMFIRLPNKLEELKKEGEALHHCVGTYTEKVRKGETMIFFIRQKTQPDKSFYTLEWKGSVVQCRGMRNCDMTPEVKAFVKIFEKKMQEYEKAPESKKRKAG